MAVRRRATQVAFAVLLTMPSLCASHAVRAETSSVAVVKPDNSACRRATFRVIVDVGHTVEEGGATSARGAPEYDFNLRLAERIERTLATAGFGKTELLITAGPTIAGLVRRVAHANTAQADLFLSIHHDAVPDYFLEKWEYDGAEHHFSDRFRGHSIFVSYDNVNRPASLQFGKLLGRQLKARGLQYTRHYTEAFMRSKRRELVDADAGVYRFDKLYVLREARMPAVLLEAGSILNRDEELLMKSPEQQALISASVTDAVEAFCALRSQRTPDQSLRGARTQQPPKIVQPAAARPPVNPVKRQ